jgi:hypothetical protein
LRNPRRYSSWAVILMQLDLAMKQG